MSERRARKVLNGFELIAYRIYEIDFAVLFEEAFANGVGSLAYSRFRVRRDIFFDCGFAYFFVQPLYVAFGKYDYYRFVYGLICFKAMFTYLS